MQKGKEHRKELEKRIKAKEENLLLLEIKLKAVLKELINSKGETYFLETLNRIKEEVLNEHTLFNTTMPSYENCLGYTRNIHNFIIREYDVKTTPIEGLTEDEASKTTIEREILEAIKANEIN